MRQTYGKGKGHFKLKLSTEKMVVLEMNNKSTQIWHLTNKKQMNVGQWNGIISRKQSQSMDCMKRGALEARQKRKKTEGNTESNYNGSIVAYKIVREKILLLIKPTLFHMQRWYDATTFPNCQNRNWIEYKLESERLSCDEHNFRED